MKRAVVLVSLTLFLFIGWVRAEQTTLVDAPAPIPSAARSTVPDPFAVLPDPAREQEKPGGLHVGDWSLIGGAAVLRVLDYTTTERAMAHPDVFHEFILPKALVENKAGFAAFQASTVVADFYVYRFLVRHHMRSLAVPAQFLYDSAMLFQVTENYQTLGKAHLR